MTLRSRQLIVIVCCSELGAVPRALQLTAHAARRETSAEILTFATTGNLEDTFLSEIKQNQCISKSHSSVELQKTKR